jgi:hypothetical protein
MALNTGTSQIVAGKHSRQSRQSVLHSIGYLGQYDVRVHARPLKLWGTLTQSYRVTTIAVVINASTQGHPSIKSIGYIPMALGQWLRIVCLILILVKQKCNSHPDCVSLIRVVAIVDVMLNNTLTLSGNQFWKTSGVMALEVCCKILNVVDGSFVMMRRVI